MQKIPFELVDLDGSQEKMTGEIFIGKAGIGIRIDGFGTFDCEGSHGIPIWLDAYGGTPKVRIWTDINEQDPIVIDLKDAAFDNYKGEL